MQEPPNDDEQEPMPDEPQAAAENGPDVEEQVIEEEAAGEAEFADDDPDSPDEDAIGDTTQAVLWASDWTSETILAQLKRGNIELSPRFQRRDAWSRPNKSRFIESLLLGLPVPQIVLAERTDKRGQYIVLDGKQRLLTLLHFSGGGEGKDVGFRLSGLEVRKDLSRVSYKRLSERPELQNEFNTFASQTIRAVVIKYDALPDYMIPKPKDQKDWDNLVSPAKRIEKAVAEYLTFVQAGNNGIKEKNLISLLIPIGLDLRAVDRTLLDRMDALGSRRGDAAHTSCAKALKIGVDPAAEKKDIETVVKGIIDLDVRLDGLLAAST